MDTVVITGGSRGVGRAVAADFADAGAHVVVCSRSADDIEAVAADIEADGGEATAVRADVRDEYDAERLLETAARAGDAPGVDCVVANAGVYHGPPGETPLFETSYSSFDDMLRTNARGVFATIREAVPHLSADARVLVPSGNVAREAKAGVGAYAVSKAAAEAIARQFAAELDATVGVVDLGRVDTELTNHGGGRNPESVAQMVRWAAVEADPEAVDGEVVGLAEWKRATA
ncbi:probable oxidoreductase (short-chain dehydrogenase family) [Natronomonas pharaonis DSM 2160]|uniref:Probable oxidoreductase (Short-chain dehydrogenase family) n=1 Tax=Natronomonas pharaonis (strain ATCC 35678 / DSM 2160 / CIP 103997 / JCM 8858 / NBRC 14720 / NCIMB 2260 / Gabara) TaxID=348780 RepID=A0A1U7EYZ2_NATPD|nr:SDR family oxidoreductase [Natronomonas pharaonis]CAI50472.1 probable oxidoreductase (short-chain dehydrogenase family) [Natronomonas pharaonis DSM 2160]